jgi:TRAP-type uncharacterized transport system fused permease subunit
MRGLYAFTTAMLGYMEKKLSWPLRLATLGLAAVLLSPLSLLSHITGTLIFIILFSINYTTKRKSNLITDHVIWYPHSIKMIITRIL